MFLADCSNSPRLRGTPRDSGAIALGQALQQPEPRASGVSFPPGAPKIQPVTHPSHSPGGTLAGFSLDLAGRVCEMGDTDRTAGERNPSTGRGGALGRGTGRVGAAHPAQRGNGEARSREPRTSQGTTLPQH